MAEILATIRPSGQGGDYTTASACEAGENKDWVTDEDNGLWRVEGDWSSATDTTVLDVIGGTMDATFNVKLTADSANITNGVFDSSRYELAVGGQMDIQDAYVIFESIQLNGTGGSTFMHVTTTDAFLMLDRCLVRGTGVSRLVFARTNGTMHARSCVLFNGIAEGFRADNSGTVVVHNCTAANFARSHRTVGLTTGSFTTTNCVGQDCTSRPWDGTFSGDWNISDVAQNVPGANSITDDVLFVNAAGGDYSIDPADDTGARRGGIDLSGDATLPVTLDITGKPFKFPPTMGAFEQLDYPHVLNSQSFSNNGATVAGTYNPATASPGAGGGDNRMMLFCISTRGNNSGETAVTTAEIDGEPLTLALSQTSGSGTNVRSSIFYLLEDDFPSGASSWSVNVSSASSQGIVCHVIELDGSNGAPITSVGFGNNSTLNNWSNNITTTGDLSLIFDNMASDGGQDCTPDAGQIGHGSLAANNTLGCASSKPADTGGVFAMGNDWDVGSNRQAHVILEIAAVESVGEDVLTADNLLGSAPELDAPALAQSHTLAVDDLSIAPELDAPALAQAHILAADDLSIAPELDAPALGVRHVLATDDLLGAPPELDAPALAQSHTLAADDLLGAAPELDTPALNQSHAILGDDLSIAPELDAPGLSQLHVLAAVDLLGAAPELDTPEVTSGVDHILTADNLLGAAPVLDAPALAQLHVLAGDDLAIAPELDAPGLNQLHVLAAVDLLGSAPELDTPEVSSGVDHVLTADNLTLGTPELDAPALAQLHDLAAVDVSIAPELDEPSIAQSHSFAVDDLLGGTPELDEPALNQLHILAGDGLAIAPELDTPELATGVDHVLTADNLLGGTPLLDTPALTQAHALLAVDLSISPVLDAPNLGQFHVLSALDLLGSAPLLDTPLLGSALPDPRGITGSHVSVQNYSGGHTPHAPNYSGSWTPPT